MTIRAATRSDLPILVEMGIRFLSTLYQQHCTGNPIALHSMLTHLMERDDGCVIVAERNGVVNGGICGYVFLHHMSGERVASELGWWVDPATRGSGVRLLREFEAWADELGVQCIQLVAPDDRVGAFYARRGYGAVETLYQKRITA